MRRCKHPRRVARLWSPPYLRWYHEVHPRPGQRLRDWVDAIVCLDCHAWLPLGPSRDTQETEVEVRAAKLADKKTPECEFTGCEWMGWNGDEVYATHPGPTYHTFDKLPTRNLRQWHAGYLARTIAEHDGEAEA